MNRMPDALDEAVDARTHPGRGGLPLPLGALAGFASAIVAIVLIALFSLSALQERETRAIRIRQANAVMVNLQALLSSMQDAETGQRGFLLTGNEAYLEPYQRAKGGLDAQFVQLRPLLEGNPRQAQRLAALRQLVVAKMVELEQTIELRRAGDLQGATAAVQTDRGRLTMDGIRDTLADIQRDEQAQLDVAQQQWRDAVYLSSVIQIGGSVVLAVLVIVAAVLASRAHRAREAQMWVRAGQAGLSARIQGEQRLGVLGPRVLSFLAGYLDAPVGALYLAESDGRFRRVAGFAVPPDAAVVQAGEGLVGQAALARHPLHLRELPAGYLPVNSSLGRAVPAELLVAPAVVDGRVQAVVELGFFRRLDAADLELLDRLSEVLAVAVRASRDRTHLEELLEETQRQAEELQAQQEELRVNNEELEEQGRALKTQQAQMESQQAELEQSNAQLEEQAQQLASQRDDLAQAQVMLTSRAEDLERASRYKSEFLANMSHELRTPLNSTLILAKLLADNKSGNLTPEQVKFAETITSSGTDLLNLINDILDLSKIEAGMIEVHPEPVALAPTMQTLVRGMQPLASARKISLDLELVPGLPTQIETDALRMGQILKNLLSNALKFTEKGGVTVRVEPAPADTLRFEVRDTGIGIAPEHIGLIFEAFRQADGSTHRRFGGTGLGLSISRDLAHLLGGELVVQSTPGEGSVFTLTLPQRLRDAVSRPIEAGASTPPPAVAAAGAAPSTGASVAAPVRTPSVPSALAAAVPAAANDDRDRLEPQARTILVIEDDPAFAAILRDLAHEMDFQCVLTHTATEGLMAANQYRPSAILLDMNLPDHSGLAVLDQLKRDLRTRHIPVHVVSVADYTQEALGMGAVGYDLKPVKRTQLVQALQRLEAKFSQQLRRVLLVEDDARQRESITHLLAHADIEIVGAETAQAALDHLAAGDFDCMIMDLSLPDLSGHELLERVAARDEMQVPPVIVYTGRSLTDAEEQELRRFSRSIIIKDARSPERLLDEVTLFLHQVESTLPPEAQRMLQAARDRDATLENRCVLVVEDDVRNIFALTSVLEPKGAHVQLARNGIEALKVLEASRAAGARAIDLVLMDIMMPEMDGLTCMREIRKLPHWQRLPIIALTAKAMRDDQERCLAAGANDYIAKPLDVEKLLALVRVWMPKQRT